MKIYRPPEGGSPRVYYNGFSSNSGKPNFTRNYVYALEVDHVTAATILRQLSLLGYKCEVEDDQP